MRPIDRLSRSFTRSTQTALLSCCRPDRCTFSDLRPIIVRGTGYNLAEPRHNGRPADRSAGGQVELRPAIAEDVKRHRPAGHDVVGRRRHASVPR